MTRIILILAMVATLGFAATSSSSAGTLTGMRVVRLVDHNDQTGEKRVIFFNLAPNDRMYVTRHEVEITRANGSVVSIGLLHFGNMTMSRVKP